MDVRGAVATLSNGMEEQVSLQSKGFNGGVPLKQPFVIGTK